MRIGLVSDTHGLLRPEAARFLEGSDAIVHAGDIGKPDVLDALRSIAPVHAIRGNNDEWATDLADTLALRIGAVAIYVIHDFQATSRWPVPLGTQLVVCGHSHKPVITPQPGGFLLVNPGSAGPRRFKLPVSAGEVLVDGDGRFDARIAHLLD